MFYDRIKCIKAGKVSEKWQISKRLLGRAFLILPGKRSIIGFFTGGFASFTGGMPGGKFMTEKAKSKQVKGIYAIVLLLIDFKLIFDAIAF